MRLLETTDRISIINLLKRQQEIEDIANNKTLINLWIENFKQYQNIEQLTRKVVVSNLVLS